MLSIILLNFNIKSHLISSKQNRPSKIQKIEYAGHTGIFKMENAQGFSHSLMSQCFIDEIKGFYQRDFFFF